MHNVKLKRVIGLVLLLTLGLAPLQAARAKDGNRGPDLPTPLCDQIQVPEGNKVSFHVYALGVQVYKWNGVSWAFVAPVANLFSDDNYRGQVGTHYAGPTWESNSGSRVVATRIGSCTPNATAIPWLLLQTVSTDGPGIFNSATYVQRVNTAGGLAPTLPGSYIGEEAKIPYTAEYYFYREAN
jgi:hypothetical protein